MIQITGRDGEDESRQFVFFTARRLEGFSADNFHWVPTARELGCRAYFVRDTGNEFYLKNKRPLIRLLKGIMRGFKGETIFVGSSMGAYGAIHIGAHCQPDKVIAFSPAPPPDCTMHKKLGKFPKLPPMDIHVGRHSKWKLTNKYNDVENSLLYRKYANIIYHDTDMHNVAGYLRDEGKLRDILNEG